MNKGGQESLKVSRGNQGDQILPRDAMEQVARAAKVPIFGLWETLLGDGIVGGCLIRFEEMARRRRRPWRPLYERRTALRILKGKNESLR